MNYFSLHPNVYATGQPKGLVDMLVETWVKNNSLGNGTMFLISGFANYNGGVRFYEVFEEHISKGGKVIAIFGGSTSQRLASKEVVEELLQRGVIVYVINRKRILHSKLYGRVSDSGETLIVSSGNFTGPGMSQNIESSLYLDEQTTSNMSFSWEDLVNNMLESKWQTHHFDGLNPGNPGWNLLYNERAASIVLDESQEITLLLTLSHSDTSRINAERGSKKGKGTQYFWLSKDSYDFFPPLTIRNSRGYKATYSCIINMYYKDLDLTDNNCRVTFEAENNADFRLGTSKLRYTGIAEEGDIAAITRKSENDYELKIYKKNSEEFNVLDKYTINYIGNRGKRFGYLSNEEFYKIIE